jgi:hypothetical protein
MVFNDTAGDYGRTRRKSASGYKVGQLTQVTPLAVIAP